MVKLFLGCSLLMAALPARALDISGKVVTKIFAPLPEARICLQADPSVCVLSAADGSFRFQVSASLLPGDIAAQGLRLAPRGGSLYLETPRAVRGRLRWFRASGKIRGSAQLDLPAGRHPLDLPVGDGLLFLSFTARDFQVGWKVVLPGNGGTAAAPLRTDGGASMAASVRRAGPATLLVSKAGYSSVAYQAAAEVETNSLILLPQDGENVSLLFDGKTLAGWLPSSGKTIGGAAGSWSVQGGALHGEGTVRGTLVPKEDYGNFRLMFAVRHLATTGGETDHQPCVVIWGSPRNQLPNDALGGIQFQPPQGGHWDYRDGKNTGNPGNEFTQTKQNFDNKQWHQCEIWARASTGEARMACCPLTGNVPCKGIEVLKFKDPTAGKAGPFGFQVHNKGLHDEYKNVSIEVDPKVADLVTTKL